MIGSVEVRGLNAAEQNVVGKVQRLKGWKYQGGCLGKILSPILKGVRGVQSFSGKLRWPRSLNAKESSIRGEATPGEFKLGEGKSTVPIPPGG